MNGAAHAARAVRSTGYLSGAGLDPSAVRAARPAAALTVPGGAVEELVGHVGEYGRCGLETGGFFLASAADPSTITTIAVAGTKGVRRGPDRFVVSGLAVDILSEWAEENDLRIVSTVHSHAGAPRLSLIDEQSGYRVEGFASVVVPRFASPPADPSAWGWYRFARGIWRPTMHGVTRPDPGVTVRFDEDGVR